MAAGFRDYRRISRQRGKILMEIVSAPQTQIARDRKSEREIEKERKRKTRQDKKILANVHCSSHLLNVYTESVRNYHE